MSGCIGIVNHPQAAELACQGLEAFQSRGEKGYGLAVGNSEIVIAHGKGKISNCASRFELGSLPGRMAIGHIHNDPSGVAQQPFKIDGPYGPMAVCFDGKIMNRQGLRHNLLSAGAVLQSASDAELVSHLVVTSNKKTLLEALTNCLRQIQGSFSLLLLTTRELLVARDASGFLPFSLGRVSDSYIVCSETCAIDRMDGFYLHEVNAGEIISITNAGDVCTSSLGISLRHSHCVFEHFHYARPDSSIFGTEVNETRTEFGKRLAIEAPAEADVVVPVLEGGRCGAVGFSEQSKIPWRVGLIRNQYVGRTFSAVSERGVQSIRIKHNPVIPVLANKRVVVVEDVIGRGETIRQIVGILKRARAREIHVRIVSPANAFACHYRENTPRQEDLLSHHVINTEMGEYLQADSVAFLSFDGMLEVLGKQAPSYCAACYNGNYPI